MKVWDRLVSTPRSEFGLATHYAMGPGFKDVFPELILSCGSVIITLFLQYWPKISSSLRSYFRTEPRFGAFSVILCVFLVILFTFRSL